ncbi:MAG TPA: ComEC/Rec2 family competence protein, partial [Chthoniobacterales bacterium]|nr:ComEC/Rec2 family competence protein [Chthoniobacterales bacterium]
MMSAILLFGVALERPVLAKNVLSGAGLFLLLLDPQQIFQLGFQLSFVTVAALTVAARPLAHVSFLPFRPDPWIPHRLLHPARRAFSRIARHACELLSVCCVCWLATLPFGGLIFHRVSWSNVAANFVTVPIGASMLALGISSIVAAPFCRWASTCLNNTNWLLGHVFLSVVHTFAALPYQSVNVGEPGAREHSKLVILATGRSNSIYLHSGVTDVLINPGSDAKYRRITQPFLRYQGVNRLFLLPSSRHDADHEGCLAQLERQFAGVRTTDQVKNQLRAASQRDRSDNGSTIVDLDGTGIHLSGASSNQLVSRILVRIGGYRVLLMADSHHGSLPDGNTLTFDLVCLSSPRSFPPAEIWSRFDPQVIVYTQGKPSVRSGQGPIVFLNEQGAATLELRDGSLKLQTFRGSQFTFRRRN